MKDRLIPAFRILNMFCVLDLASDGYNPIAALDPSSEDFPDDALFRTLTTR